MADEPTVSLAFFDASHYLVQPLGEKDAAIITLPPRGRRVTTRSTNFPKVGRKSRKTSSFERYPVWQRIEDQLLKQLRG